MEKRLFINPPSLRRWEPRGDRSDVISLDLEPDFPDEKTIRIELNVIFRPIAVTRGWVTTKDYYVGSTGARVVFESTGGQVKKYTPETVFEVNHEDTYTRSRKTSVKLAPTIKTGTDVEVEPGEVGFEKGVESSFTTKFTGSERNLVAVNLEDGVEWILTLPEHSALRDYLVGNLYLYVECAWPQGRKTGNIELHASDILFFDSHHRVIDGIRALLMRFVLFRQGKRLSRNKLTISFQETN